MEAMQTRIHELEQGIIVLSNDDETEMAVDDFNERNQPTADASERSRKFVFRPVNGKSW